MKFIAYIFTHFNQNEISDISAKIEAGQHLHAVFLLTVYMLSAWRKPGFIATHWVYSEDSDQTGRMPRLIWVFAGRTLTLLVLSCRDSFTLAVRQTSFLKSQKGNTLCVCHQSALQILHNAIETVGLAFASANALVSVHMDQCLIFLWILMFAISAPAYASAHMDP